MSIRRFEEMCLNEFFNESEAVDIIKNIDIDNEFTPSFEYLNVIPLEWAIIHNNIAMVKLLLKSGANPNQIFNDEETPLWNLQYNYGENNEENEKRLKIAQILLEYGANPNINPDNGPEDLFQYVLFTLFEDEYDELWKYRSRFFILLVAYGGKTDYLIPRIEKSFDKNNMWQYDLKIKSENYEGIIFDKNGDIFAFI